MTSSRLLRITYQRLRLLARRRAIDAEIDREIAFHLEQLIDEKRSEGLTEETARYAARRAFGSVSIAIEQSREARGFSWIDTIRDDVRYGTRMLVRSPLFATVASTALALGIGATAAVAGAMALVLIRPLPFSHGERLVAIRTSRAEPVVPRGAALVGEYAAWRTRNATLDAIGASRSSPRLIAADQGGAPPERVSGQAFTPSLFTMLGARPEAGRLFEDVDNPFDRRALVAVISHRLWQRRFAGAADVLGRTLIVDGGRRTIVGVMPADFRFQYQDVDVWVPLILRPGPIPGNGDAPQLIVTARLKPGIGIERARADLQAVATDVGGGASIEVVPLRDALFGWTVPRLATLAAGAGLLLILACANIAGLLLSRGRARVHEMALRAALGATRARLARQLLIESALLGSIAAVPSLAVTWIGLRFVARALSAPPGLPHPGVTSFDATILAAVIVLAVACPVAFGIGPALSLSRKRTALSTISHRVAAPAPIRRSWHALIGVQVAIASLLLIAAMLLTTTYQRISARELNFEPNGLITFDYSIPAGAFAQPLGIDRSLPSFQINPAAARTIKTVHEQLARIDGVQGAAGISFPPVNSLVLPTTDVRLTAGGDITFRRSATAAFFLVTPGLFAVFRTPILRGREFESSDDLSAPWTVVINEALARLCCSDGDPIGKTLRLDNGPDERPRRIVGVVKNIPTRLNQVDPQPIVYASYLQEPERYRGRAPGMFGGMTFVLRSPNPVANVVDAARQAISAAPSHTPIVDIGTLQAHLHGGLMQRDVYAAGVLAYAVVSILLAVLGVYGVTAYSVSARSGEIAVRRALGATHRDALRAIGQPIALTVAGGVLTGLAAALALGPWIAPQLWGVTASDPQIYGAAAVIVVTAAALACAMPFRRVVGLDVAARLRTE